MSPNRRILFVCLHGAAKSVLAAADCERLHAEQHGQAHNDGQQTADGAA